MSEMSLLHENGRTSSLMSFHMPKFKIFCLISWVYQQVFHCSSLPTKKSDDFCHIKGILDALPKEKFSIKSDSNKLQGEEAKIKGNKNGWENRTISILLVSKKVE